MEELLTTDVLDREILEDARKKAFKILKSADDSIQALVRRWDKKSQKAVDDIRRNYEKRTQDESDEINARSPVDRRRLRLEISESFLKDAMEKFLLGMERKDILLILEKEMKECLASCPETEFSCDDFQVIYGSMNTDEANDVVRNAFGNVMKNIPVYKMIEEKLQTRFPSLIINTGKMRIAVSVDKTAERLLKTKRAELAAALLGPEALND